MLQKPWPVICSLVYPGRHSAVFTVLLDIGRVSRLCDTAIGN
jgi:hypothetical protein